MIACDESALICDFAETYHIYDYRALPLSTAAVLASGLREDSRIRMKMAGCTVALDLLLSAAILDRLTWLVWANSTDSQDGSKRPESILAKLTGRKTPSEYRVFDSPEDFEAARRAILQKGG